MNPITAHLQKQAQINREVNWAKHLSAGITRVNLARRKGKRISPTKFYKLLHGSPQVQE